MKDSNSNNIKTGWVLAILIVIVLLVVGFYFFNFNFDILKNGHWLHIFQNLSKTTGDWGTFGDYVGGILNPLIAAFAFYLIAKTYELQKKELEETRKLLQVSTDAQKDQITLAALTALLNSNMARINMLEARKHLLFQGKTDVFANKLEKQLVSSSPIGSIYKEHKTEDEIMNLANEIRRLVDNNSELEALIRQFLKTN